MPRRSPPSCRDCGALILWAHLGEKDAPGTRWLSLDAGNLDPQDCVRPVPFEGQPLHDCGAKHARWWRSWREAWAAIGWHAGMSLHCGWSGRLERT
jgi:hypothetical protein